MRINCSHGAVRRVARAPQGRGYSNYATDPEKDNTEHAITNKSRPQSRLWRYTYQAGGYSWNFMVIAANASSTMTTRFACPSRDDPRSRGYRRSSEQRNRSDWNFLNYWRASMAES